MNTRVEYRVIPVTRYTITCYSESLDGTSGGVSTKGEYSNEEVAYEVAYALCKAEHERLGLPVGSDLVKYPEPVFSQNTASVRLTSKFQSLAC